MSRDRRDGIGFYEIERLRLHPIGLPWGSLLLPIDHFLKLILTSPKRTLFPKRFFFFFYVPFFRCFIRSNFQKSVLTPTNIYVVVFLENMDFNRGGFLEFIGFSALVEHRGSSLLQLIAVYVS